MTDDKKKEEEAMRAMAMTSGGSPLPTGIDRRAQRRKRAHSVYRAIKAEHSGEQTRMQVIADWLTSIASSTGFFFTV